ncbi:Fur family transcriptional regulator [Mycoplasma sp. E35C]|uniref:Fur family transcriptional regulator n=1 Tax=Mycoplasma sp. E35C TaxID=2801918 RepID=UPI001CA3C773|nr:transcriptional repressor [Mycoplasma sp. E35C]QZX49454.1 transcriptional repressor [Mycoplasma sp. E35C]
MKNNQLDNYLKILNDNKYRITSPRRLVLECLLDSSDYHSIEDIIDHIEQKTNKKPNIASIYNVLQTFIQLNIVDSFLNTSHDLKRYYTIKHEHHEHIYFINTAANQNKDLNTLVIPEEINKSLVAYFNKLKIKHPQYYIVVSGECKDNIITHKNDETK